MIYSNRLCKVYINLLPLVYFKIFPLLSANICGRGRFIAISLHITVILNVILKGSGNIFHIRKETFQYHSRYIYLVIFLFSWDCPVKLRLRGMTMINSGFMGSNQPQASLKGQLGWSWMLASLMVPPLCLLVRVVLDICWLCLSICRELNKDGQSWPEIEAFIYLRFAISCSY